MKENPQSIELRHFGSAVNSRHSCKGKGGLLLASFSETQGLTHLLFSSSPSPCGHDAIHRIAQ